MNKKWYYNDWFIAMLFIFFFLFLIPVFVALLILEKRKNYYKSVGIKNFSSEKEMNEYQNQITNSFTEKNKLLEQEIEIIKTEIKDEEKIFADDDNLIVKLEAKRKDLIIILSELVYKSNLYNKGIVDNIKFMPSDDVNLGQEFNQKFYNYINDTEPTYIMVEDSLVEGNHQHQEIYNLFLRTFIIETIISDNNLIDLFDRYNIKLSKYGMVINQEVLSYILIRNKLLDKDGDNNE